MKVRNFAFFGVMASILGISAANAASDTVIASQAYVDAVANTKQPTLQNTHITDTQTGQFITDITATNGQITVTRGNAPATDLTDYETSQHASETYQPIISDLETIRTNARDAQKASDSNVAERGNYIAAGNGVGANLTALDTELKKKADSSNVYTKTETDSAISTATSGLETTTHASSTYQPIISDLDTIRTNARDAQKASDSKVEFAEGEEGYKITAGNKVGANLKALDKELKEVATTAATTTNKQEKSTADYQMGNSSGTWTAMTTAQQNALNSGITSAKVSTYDDYATTIAGKQDTISDLETIRTNARDAQKASESKVEFAEGEEGYKITAGNKVGANLKALDKELKEVATTAATITNKQNKSTADYQMGNSSGTWTAMTQAQQDALNSGATSTNIGQISGKVNIQQDARDKNKIVMTGEEGKIDTFVSIDPNTMVIDDHGNLAARIPSASNFIEDAITDNVTNKAPSENAVFDALALKANAATTYTKTEVDTALAGKQAAFSDGSTTGSGEAVTSVTQAAGKVDATKSVLHYNKAMEYKLPNYTTGKTAEQFVASECSAENPCVLTIVGMDSNGQPNYEWTQMAL